MSTHTSRLGILRRGAAASLLAALLSVPFAVNAQDTSSTSTTTVMCKDGTTATHTGKGACSHHGGVDKSASSSSSSSGSGGSTGSSGSSGSGRSSNPGNTA